ncbi:glutathione S-transferase N-terminal domain-containing protein [Pseudomonadales bacterium]|nr:glutathione S-transferase N-terminal domain-containing protein [Pseudomonadales bacterium]
MFDGHYVMWGGEHSLFTRKLEAMLNYQGLDYEFKLKTRVSGAEMEARLGTHFIPGLQTPEGWFIHDTTPIGLMLNEKYPDRAIVPSTPVQRIAAQ